MAEFWKFEDALVVAQYNWTWLAGALVIGLIVGWLTCGRGSDSVIEDK